MPNSGFIEMNELKIKYTYKIKRSLNALFLTNKKFFI